MKNAKSLIAAALLLLSTNAEADIIRCVFTEPFLNLTYSMAQQKLTVQTPEGTAVYRNVGFQILGVGHFIIGPVASPRLDLRLDFHGSDGMSDFVYPYSATLPYPHGPLEGGCESNFLTKQPGEE